MLLARDVLHNRGKQQAHEILHGWNGKTFTFVDNGDGWIYQLETWIFEGTTIYYDHRVDGLVVGGSPDGGTNYRGMMEGNWGQYTERIGTASDRPYAELSLLASPFVGDDNNIMLHARGLSLNYLLDLELTKIGSSLDRVMRYLYVFHGLQNQNYLQGHFAAAVQAVSGQSFDWWFAAYLDTNADLRPLLAASGGQIQYLEH